MAKHFYILLLTLGCFLMMPAQASACGKKHGKTACKKENVLKAEKKDCCDKDSHSGNDHGCKGKCGHSSCVMLASYSLLSTADFDFTVNNYSFRSKEKFYHAETDIASGFYSLWLPPKIK